MNQREAYENAGFKARGKTARAAASRLLANVNFRKHYERSRKRAENKAEATQTRVLKEECRIAYSDIAGIFDGPTLIPPGDIPEDVRRAISLVKVKTRTHDMGDDKETETTYEYKLWDKGAALNRLEKHLGMHAPEKHEHTGKDGGPIEIKNWLDEIDGTSRGLPSEECHTD